MKVKAAPAAAQPTLPGLTPAEVPGLTFLNRRVVLRDDDLAGLRVVSVAGTSWLVYGHDDYLAQRFACAMLVISGHASQTEVVKAFGVPRRTLHRLIATCAAEGVEGLVPYRPTGRKSIVEASVVRAVVRLHHQGFGMRRIGQRLGLTPAIIRGVYSREGLRPVGGDGTQTALEPSAQAVVAEGHDDAAASGDTVAAVEPAEQDGERSEPCEGLWTPRPEGGTGVARAGVLLAVPMLTKLGVLEVMRKVYSGTLGVIPRYGLEVVVCVMVFMALWRIKRPEGLKRVSPEELGRVLGLERVPEMKTVRRKLQQLARLEGGALDAMRRLAEARLAEEDDLLGVLYIDGHVRPYSGTHKVADGYCTQRRSPVPATTDVWANDRHGDPVFVVTAQINEHLTQVLEPVLAQARAIAGEQRRVTVVFDRGGWSPTLFTRLIASGFDLITYRKGTVEELSLAVFEERSVTASDGQVTSLHLHDDPAAVVSATLMTWPDGSKRPLVMREITKLMPATGKQTRVVTTRLDLEAQDVLQLLFARWRQENFFKYMREEMALDALVEYGAEAVSDHLDRPNPEVKAIERKMKKVQAEISKLQGQRCELIGEGLPGPLSPPGFVKFVPEKARRVSLLAEIRELKQTLQELDAQRAELPKRVSAHDLQRLLTARKQVADLFKMVAYQVETELVRLVAPHYARHEEEARALISAAFSSSASFEVTRSELRIILAPLSSPHRTKALAALCDRLNQIPSKLPGTALRLRFACAPDPA